MLIILSYSRNYSNLCDIANLYMGSSVCGVSVLGCGLSLELPATEEFGQDPLCPHHQCGAGYGHPTPPLSHPLGGWTYRTQESSHYLLRTGF